MMKKGFKPGQFKREQEKKVCAHSRLRRGKMLIAGERDIRNRADPCGEERIFAQGHSGL